MRIMTLDGGGILGFAHGDPFGDGGPPISGSHRLPAVQLTQKMIGLESFVVDIVKGNEITDLYFEKSIIPAKTSYDAVVLLAGYNLIAAIAAVKCGVNAYPVDLQTWRSALGLPTQGPKNVLADPHYADLVKRKDGKGLVKDALKIAKRQYVKDQAVAYARRMGSDPKDDNEADAICMWHYVAQRARDKADRRPTDLFETLTI